MTTVRFRSRDLLIDDACRHRAEAAGCDPVEQRLWEAGFSRAAAQQAALEIGEVAPVLTSAVGVAGAEIKELAPVYLRADGKYYPAPVDTPS